MRKIKSIPPTYFYICFILNIALYFVLPKMRVIIFPYNFLGTIVIFFGVYFNIWAWFLFKKNNTPEKFEKSTCIVKEGLYRFTRNPMYLGMVLILLGLSICLGNLICLISPIIFLIIISLIFIPYEEKKMQDTFGQEYLDYKNSVRRWL